VDARAHSPLLGAFRVARLRGPCLTEGDEKANPPGMSVMSRLAGVRYLVAALAMVASLCLARESAAQQASMKVGVVDVQRAVMQTEDGLRATATLKKLFDSRQQELNRKQTELQKQKEDIDKQSRVLSKEAYTKRMEELQKQLMELQAVFVDYNKELEKKQKEMTDPIFERIMGIVKRIATTESYDLVVDKATVAYVRTDLDLTDKCIQLYNSGGAATPAPAAPAGSAAPK
jgi:outer membrane protein